MSRRRARHVALAIDAGKDENSGFHFIHFSRADVANRAFNFESRHQFKHLIPEGIRRFIALI